MGTKTRNQRLRSGQLNIAARSTRPNSFKKETLAEKPMQEDNGNFVYLIMPVAHYIMRACSQLMSHAFITPIGCVLCAVTSTNVV